MDKFDHDINRTYIMELDQNCADGKNRLPRNFDFAPAKDTIQVPPGGYVILRTKLDNAGTWIFHCHINFHVEIGMAMVLQIGELGKPNLEGQDWCTGPLKRNEVCETPPPSPGGGNHSFVSIYLLSFILGPAFINWYYGMENAHRCVKPGI